MANRFVVPGFVAAFVGLVGACSASGEGPSGAGGSGGSGVGNNAGTGAVVPVGGSSTGTGGNGGTAGTPVVSVGGAQNINEGGAPPICDSLTVNTEPLMPTVEILVDNSSSMFEPTDNPAWDYLYTALMDPVDGVVKPLEGKVRFGFASYKGSTTASTEADPACATITSVDIALNNHAAIDAVYSSLGDEWMPGIKWETPTGHAINRVAETLAAFNADPPGPKYILLVTDGNPNTCAMLDPQCGQDLSIKAVQDAYALGIGTFAVGIGDLVTNPNNGCQAEWGRCGDDHLQDLANAGQGLPVADPPENYKYQGCTAGMDGGAGVVQATYASTTGATPGTAPYFTATDAAALQTAILGLLNQVVSCTLDMDAIVTGNPTLGVVTVNGAAVPINDPNGWILEPNNYQVTLQGTACETFKTVENSEVNVEFPCDPETGEPIAEPR
jgi:hypothetical protein